MGLSKKRTGAFYLTNLLLTAALFAAIYVLLDGKILTGRYATLITLVCVNIILAVSLNLVTGILGQLVLGHAGFMLVGAYASALFTKNVSMALPVSFPISLLLAGSVAALFGILIGIPALRLRGDYLAIITLGFGEIIRVMANAEFLKPITNGAMGLAGIPTLYNRRTSPAGLFVYAFIIMALVIFINFSFGRSRHGRAVIAIREDEIAAESAGINTTYYKLFAFVLAAFFAGMAGGIYANQYQMIDPSKFDFNRSVEILIMVVLGGMGSITGSVISATVLTILPEVLRDVLQGFDFDQYRMLIYSIILIAVMLFKPTGLLGRYEISIPGLSVKLKDRLSRQKLKKSGEA